MNRLLLISFLTSLIGVCVLLVGMFVFSLPVFIAVPISVIGAVVAVIANRILEGRAKTQ